MIVFKVILTVIHVLVSIVLMVAILLQASKGGGLAATFGGQASSIFGPRSAASALSTLTKYLATAFLVISFTLSLMASGGTGGASVTQRVLEKSPAQQLPAVGDLNFGNTQSGENPAAAPVNPLDGSAGQ